MTTPHKAMLIQARDALLSACGGRCNAEYNPCEAREVADALTAYIDAPEPEPVAHIRQTYIVGLDGELLGVSEKKELRFGCGNDYAHCTPLYTHPPAVREPLTREQKKQMWRNATIEMCSHENCYWRGIADAEAAHGITAPLIQAKHLPADDTEGGAP